MHVEVSVAQNFVISYLYNKLPRRRVDIFGDELEKQLKKKFEGHWYPDKPFKGSAYRCIRVSGENMDPVMQNAARDCGLAIEEIKDYLPADLTLWIDPCEVSYRIGEKGQAKILFSEKPNPTLQRTESDPFEAPEPELQVITPTRGFNPEAQSFKPIDSLSLSMNNLSVTPTSPTPQAGNGWRTSPASPNQTSVLSVPSYPMKSNSTPNFTAATFAQTKFGSTKLKSQAKRPTRLSPTEMSSYMKHRSPMPQLNFANGIPNGRPHTLSPRQEFLDPQGRMFPVQRPQHISPTGSLGPIGGSMGDIYNSGGWPYQEGYHGARTPVSLGTPSPDGNKSLVENLAQMQASQSGFHQLLVANS